MRLSLLGSFGLQWVAISALPSKRVLLIVELCCMPHLSPLVHLHSLCKRTFDEGRKSAQTDALTSVMQGDDRSVAQSEEGL